MTPGTVGRVGQVVDRVRRYAGRRATVAGAVGFGALVLAVLLLAWLVSGPDGWRTGNPWPLLLDLLVVAAVFGGGVRLRHWIRRDLDDRSVSSVMERAAGLDDGSVLGSLQVERATPAGTSRALAREAGRETARRLSGDAREASGALGQALDRWTRRGSGALGVLVPLVVLVLVLTPERTAQAWAGLVRPVTVLRGEALPPLDVQPGDAEVVRGAPIEVRVDAAGRDQVTLVWRPAGAVTQRLTAEVEAGVARFGFARLEARTEYHAVAPDGARSPGYVLTPVDPLLVTDLQLALTFPPHTGRPPEEYRGRIPELTVPVGTRISVSGRSSRTLADAAIELEGTVIEVPFEVAGPVFRGDWRPTRSGRYTWRFLAPGGLTPELQPDPVDVVLVRDSVPSVRIVFPAADTTFPLSLRQPLVVEARDDYGLRDLQLEAWRPQANVVPQPTIQGLPLDGARAVLARPTLDASGWTLLPGDSVRYRVRTTDNSPAEQFAVSEAYLLRVPTVGELRRSAQDELEDAAERLRELAEQAARQAEETRSLEQQTGQEGESGDQLDFSERERMEQALADDQRMADEVEAMAEELERLQEALAESGLMDPELRRDLEELQALLDEIASDELRAQLDKLSESMERGSGEEARENLEELGLSEEELRQRLEESLERFRRAAVDQDFRATTEEARELAQREEAIADALEAGEDPELRAEQQAELEQEAADLMERMERLQERLEELGESQASEGVEQAQQTGQQARQTMSEAQQQARTGQQQAGETAQAAAEAMQQMAEQLEQAQSEMAQRMAEAMREALEQTSNDALALAEEQTRLRQEMRGRSTQELQEMRGDQAAITEGARNLGRALDQATRINPQAGARLAELAQAAEQASASTSEALDRRRGSAPSPTAEAERVVAALNGLAVAAMAAAQQVGEQAQGQTTAEQMAEALEQLAEQQSDVNQQSSMIMPMQLGQQSMQQQLQEISQGQQAVASELGQLSQDPGSEGALGDLETLSVEAEEIARALAEGRLDRETLERQQRLFHRLLDAGRSLEKDEESEERESETPGAFDRAEVVPLTDEALGAIRYQLPPAEILDKLAPAERQLVRQYFERLNRSERRDPPPPAPPRR